MFHGDLKRNRHGDVQWVLYMVDMVFSRSMLNVMADETSVVSFQYHGVFQSATHVIP